MLPEEAPADEGYELLPADDGVMEFNLELEFDGNDEGQELNAQPTAEPHESQSAVLPSTSSAASEQNKSVKILVISVHENCCIM